jgi:hypothetical protein
MTPFSGMRALLDWLDQLRRRGKLLAIGCGAMWTVIVAAVILLLVPVLEAVFRFSPTGRWILVLVSVVVAGAVFLGGVWLPWFSLLFLRGVPRDEALAAKVGQRVPSIRDHLLNALQLKRLFQDNREKYSQSLANEAVSRVVGDLERVDLRQVESGRRVRGAAKILGGAVVVLVVVYMAAGGALTASLHRLSHPSEDFPRPLPFELYVLPGNIQALKGDTVAVEIYAQGKIPATVLLYSKADSRREADEVALSAGVDSVFRCALGPVRESMDYWVESGPVTAGPYRLTVRERPFIRSLQARIIPPEYSGLPVTIGEENVGDVTALKGSRVELKAQTNLELAEAWLELLSSDEDTTRQDMEVLGNRLHGTLTVMDDFRYRIRLQDYDGVGDRDPIWYRVTGLSDREPSVRIVQPPGDVEITESMMLPLLVEAEDDFGLSSMALRYHRSSVVDPEDLGLDDYDKQSLRFAVGADGLARADWLWDLEPLDLLPEDEVSFYAEVWDNDQVTGPKLAISEVLVVRFPSLEDLYAETDDFHDDMEMDLMETLEAARELAETMEEITEEWKRNPEMTWDEEQRMQQVMEQQEELAKTVEDITQRMKEMVESLQENTLFTQETLTKYMELQELFQRVATEELREAMRKLSEALQKQTPEDLLRAMEEFQLTQEEFEKQLDRSLNILKQLELEMKMDELVKRVDDLLKRQESINEQVEQSAEGESSEDLASQEEDMSSDMESVENGFQQAQEMANDAMGQTPQDMNDIDQFMEEQQIPGQMSSMAGSMCPMKKQQAGRKGRKISRDLNQLSQMMQQAKQNIVESKREQLLAAMERVTANLLRLSFREEDLLMDSRELDVSSPRFDEIAEWQQDARLGLDRVADSLYAIARETFFIDPRIGAALGEAMQNMDGGIDACNRRDSRRLRQNTRGAMGALNRAAMFLQRSADQMCRSCSSTGAEEMMQRLSQMSCQQEGLNQNTLSLFQGNQGQWTMEQQAQMRRLAAEQGQIRKSLEELAEEAGEAENLLGRLDEVGKQMGEVVNDLQDMNVDERTIRRQEKILTRLLDAQRSVREREYSPKRRSRPGEDIVRASPRMREPHTDAESLRQDLLKALEGHYVRDYERLIRQYFDALARESVHENK